MLKDTQHHEHVSSMFGCNESIMAKTERYEYTLNNSQWAQGIQHDTILTFDED